MALAALLVFPSTVSAQEALSPLGSLFVTSEVGGHFVDPVCDEGITLRPAPFARYARTILSRRRERDGGLMLDTGGLFEPHGVTRFAAEHAPDALGELIDALGYRAVAFGESELYGPRDAVLATARALRQRSIPMVASNLYCDAEATELCEAVVDARDGVSMHELDGRRLAFIALLDPEVLTHTAPHRRAGVRIAPLGASMERAVGAANAAGADLVVVSISNGDGPEALTEALETVRSVPRPMRPDLVLIAGAGDQMLFARPVSFRPAVAASPPGQAIEVALRHNRHTDTRDILVQPLPAAEEAASPVERFATRVGAAYCEVWGAALTGGRLERDMSREDLKMLAARSMREATGGEVAFIHDGAVAPSWAPVHPRALRASDLHVGLPYDDPLVTAVVEGTWLREVARHNHDREALTHLGLTIEKPRESDEKVKVNGRPLETRARYRVVTTRFLASGGYGMLPEGPTWEPVEGMSLREAVLAHLREEREGDPRDDFRDPAQRAEWSFLLNVDAVFGGSVVRNPGDYPDTQFDRSNTTAFGFQLQGRLNAAAPKWAWDNQYEARYRIAAIEGSDFEEGDDRLSLRTTGRYSGFRAQHAYFYVPEPIVEVYFESELTIPGENDHRHMLLRPTAGVQFTLTDELAFKATAGFDTQLLDPDVGVRPGAGVQLVLKPWHVMDSDGRRVTLQSTVDYFVSDLGGLSRQTLRGGFGAELRLTQAFALAMNLDLFGVRENDGPFSVSTNATASLRLGWVGRAIPRP